ncbi:MAG: hypothetical protein MI865_01620, partial [Proteobacteria bacterium]|nr:hypothetical protein [Pseudomonadota bacterium]
SLFIFFLFTCLIRLPVVKFGSMDLKFISPRELSGTAKATVHKTGKLGLSAGAADKLDLDDYSDKYVKVAINGDYTDDKNLYIILLEDESEDVYKVAKAGQYFYINLKHLFEKLNEDYKNDSIVYDVRKGDFDENGYILQRRK